jgi:hypothetical protein
MSLAQAQSKRSPLGQAAPKALLCSAEQLLLMSPNGAALTQWQQTRKWLPFP